MGKRSNFERNERDYYPTPYEAVIPLLSFLTQRINFVEPCAGDYRLAEHLERHGHNCVYACDIEPQHSRIEKKDVLFFDFSLPVCDYIITNPPWEREVLHCMIDKFISVAPTWLLFDSDWMHNIIAAPYLTNCEKIVSVGRVKWIPDSEHTGMDNCCWYLFHDKYRDGPKFYGRKERTKN